MIDKRHVLMFLLEIDKKKLHRYDRISGGSIFDACTLYNVFSTSGDVQYIGGVQYIGDTMSTSGGYHEYSGGIP